MKTFIKFSGTVNAYAMVQMSQNFVRHLKRFLHREDLQFAPAVRAYAHGGGWYAIYGNPAERGRDIEWAVKIIRKCEYQVQKDMNEEIRYLLMVNQKRNPEIRQQVRDNQVKLTRDINTNTPRTKLAAPQALHVLQTRINNKYHRG